MIACKRARRLTEIERKNTQRYYQQIFGLFPEKIRPESRETFIAYDGMNNLFNLTYEILAWKVHKALVKAKLEPYLGFLYSNQIGKLSLVCDFQELYRYLMDDFLIGCCQNIRKRDFIIKSEQISKNKIGYRQYLDDLKTDELMDAINKLFVSTVKIPNMRFGEKQIIETLINQEAQIFAKYLRNERKTWVPRIPNL